MKVSQQGGVLPLLIRPRKTKRRALPYRFDVPPDSVDVQLLPRLNLYGRAPLRFHQLGTTSTKQREGLKFYQEQINPHPQGTPSREELLERVEALRVEHERLRELERRSIYEPQAEEHSDETRTPSSVSPTSPQPHALRVMREPVGVMRAPESSEEGRLEDEREHGQRFAEWVREVTLA
jgi:spore cortex formation protein SpoVR/YcgB (stage V sporulation)